MNYLKRKIQDVYNFIGYRFRIEKVKKTFEINGYIFDIVKPFANYSPWLTDVDFLYTYTQIKNNTLVDIFRCYELWQLAEMVSNIDNTSAFIEIGVWRGGTAAITGKKLKILESNVNFYLADTFKGVAKATENDPFYNGGEHADTDLFLVTSLVNKIYSNYTILEGIFPEETKHLIQENEKFGYCHIDVDVYESAKDIVEWIWERMILGGIIIFDDYGFHTCSGITKYVNEQRGLKDRLVIHNLNGHAIIIKIK